MMTIASCIGFSSFVIPDPCFNEGTFFTNDDIILRHFVLDLIVYSYSYHIERLFDISSSSQHAVAARSSIEVSVW